MKVSFSVAFDAPGALGGLAIAWNSQTISLSDLHASHNFIQASFHLVGSNTHGHLTNVYFPKDPLQKISLLNSMAIVNSSRCHPLWICGGDFNMISKLEEKLGGRTRLETDNICFKDFIQDSWLIDLPFSNGMHTWTNKRGGTQQVSSRLDRFLILDNSIHLGGDFHSSILPLAGSNHWPILLQWSCPGTTNK